MEPRLVHTESLGIYVHVPFCIRKCRYCDFYSVSDANSTLTSDTIASTLDQLVYYFEHLGRPRISSLYIGGGTPSAIGVSMTGELLRGIRETLRIEHGLPDELEFTVEVNPESVTEKLLDTYKQAGVNRLSAGVQTFDERYFEAIGRVGSPEITKAALEMVKRVWSGSLSLDLMTAFPGQLLEDGVEDVKRLLAYAPDHVSLYTLTIAPGTPLYDDLENGKFHVPGDQESTVWERQVEMLKRSGFRHYEVSNFAVPGYESRHNLRYWRLEPYLGCGPAAASTVPGQNGPLRIENCRSLDRFLRTAGTGSGHGEDIEEIDAGTFFLEHLIMGLRLTEGIERARIERIFGVDPVVPIADTLRKWERMVDYAGRYLRLTQSGRMLMDSFLKSAALEIENYRFESCRWPDLDNPAD